MWRNINNDNSLFLVIDLQEKFYPLIKESVIDNARKNVLLVIKMFNKLGIPMIGTEHYVKGLGHTDQEILKIWEGPDFTDKVSFSCCRNEAFQENFKKNNKKYVIVAGLETHICVLQTVLDLIDQKYEVIVLPDVCVSSTKLRWKNGLELMKKAGAHIVNSESLLFYLLKRADSEEFKYMVKLLKNG